MDFVVSSGINEAEICIVHASSSRQRLSGNIPGFDS